MTPAETLNALESFDQKWAKVLREHGDKTVCHRGCSACCSEPCYTSRDEADLLVSKIPAAERAGVVERTRDWMERMLTSGLLQQGTPHVQVYLGAKLVCPLLKDNLCLVYAARPLACRSHCAVGASSDLCVTDRMNQKFASSPELLLATARHLMQDGDHLGVWLSLLLLGESTESAARVGLDYAASVADQLMKAAESLHGAAADLGRVAASLKKV